MILTASNYYSLEADHAFMNCSQFQAWNECEAREYAILGEYWQDDPSEAFLVGNYFHSYFEGAHAHEAFKRTYIDRIYKTRNVGKKGRKKIIGMYEPFETAERMIAVITADPFIKGLMNLPGLREHIITGELFGVPWRCRFDKYVPADGSDDTRLIIDWKTCKSIYETVWNPETRTRETFIEAYGYMFRAAVYTELEKQHSGWDTDAQFILAAVSKQKYPDKDTFSLNHRQRYDYELQRIKDRLPYIQRIKEGYLKPTRCGVCDYCRATKQIFTIRPYTQLMPEFTQRRDEDYAAGAPVVIPPTPGVLDSLPPVW